MFRTLRCLLVAMAIIPCGARALDADEPAPVKKLAVDPMIGTEAGQVRDDNGLTMKLVWCPPGFVRMDNLKVHFGAKDEPSVQTDPVHVFLSNGYWLGKYELTQRDWNRVAGTQPWKEGAAREKDDFPATWVSWDDAMEFCRKFTEQEHRSGRLPADWAYTLPTEAQWERACRARAETNFSFGDDESQLGEFAWFRDNTMNEGEAFTHQVGQKRANEWGFFDMHGNVHEWCLDTAAEKLPGGRDPEVTANEKTRESQRLIRGGAWNDVAINCRSSKRAWHVGSGRGGNLGFRVALIPVRSEK